MLNFRSYLLALVFIACSFISMASLQALELPQIFATNMVLQQKQPIAVWGTAKAGSDVHVAFGHQTVKTKANEKGQWKLSLKAEPANATPQTMIVTGDGTTINYANILVGEVWICSGQSNMSFSVKSADNAKQAIAGATDKLIRLCRVGRTIAAEPMMDAKISWKECNPKTAPSFTAVGYFFGKMLRENINVPIGLINSSWGGTPAEAWTDHQTLTSVPKLENIIPNAEKAIKKYPAQLKKWQKAMEAHKEKVAKWVANNHGKTAKDSKIRAPRKPRTPGKNPRHPSVLYNGMINPLIPYGIRGAIWYQGEGNSGRPDEYRTLLPAMINNWRTLWNQGDFPFGIVQLANFRSTKNKPTNTGWAHLQNAQQFTSLSVPNTGLAVINDIGAAKNIHPKNKQDVGKRLALWALHDIYKTISDNWSPPLYVSHKINGNKVTLTFDRVDGQIKARDGKELAEFIICGEDKKWVWAKAKITSSNTIEVWADAISKPVAVRYAWSDNPANANLTDDSNLPASLFKTDDWPYRK